MASSHDNEIIQLKAELNSLKEKYERSLRLEEDLQNSQAIFLRNLSQNIRIPMNGVMGMLDVLKMTKLNPEQEDYVSLISNYNNNLISIINDILDYSNLMNNSLVLMDDYFDLKKLTDEITDLLHYKIEGKGLQFSVQINEQIPELLFGDQVRIKQILINLLNNSIRHTREGEILLSVEHIEEINQQSILKFSVKDSGLGIKNSLATTLQNELETAGPTPKISLNGLGLGLAITQSLLKLMDSYLEFKTELGEGAEFWFTVAIATRHKNRSGVINKDQPGQRSLRILLVEDNMLNQKFAKVTLTRSGYYLDIAENGKIALEKFKLNTYDLILMDIQLPIMSGIEATLEIRKFEKETKQEPIKIIAVTAFALDNKRDECMAAGMDSFLAKPFKPQQLIRMIDEVKFV